MSEYITLLTPIIVSVLGIIAAQSLTIYRLKNLEKSMEDLQGLMVRLARLEERVNNLDSHSGNA